MPSASSTAFIRHVYAVQRYVSLTATRYAPLCKGNAVAHPICCFGDLRSACFVTVGLNPSDGEFARARGWPTEMEHTALAQRCCDYFSNPHSWFQPWSEGLKHVNGTRYQDGTAAHIDLSPRATRPVSAFREDWERQLFLEMVERDLWTFFGTLELCGNVRCVLMAGSVTGKYYINEFIQRFAPEHGSSLDGPFNRLEHPGAGKVAWHCLSSSRRRLPVFFCSSSPSANDKTLLPRRIKEHAQVLIALQRGEHHPVCSLQERSL